MQLQTLLLKIPRNTEVTPESAQTFLATLTQINAISGIERLMGKKPFSLALEVALVNQQIKFFITCDIELVPFIESQLRSNYPLVIIEKVIDPLEGQSLDVVSLSLRQGSYYPIALYNSFVDIDPLSSILSVLSKGDPDEFAMVQIALRGVGSGWQTSGANYAEFGTKKEDGTYTPRSDAAVIKEKISYPGFAVSIRLASNTKKTLNELASTFGVFTRSDGNAFRKKGIGLLDSKSKYVRALRERQTTENQILNIVEVATIWHLPNEKIKTPSILWGTSVLSEPPINLPVAMDMSEEDRLKANFFAKTQFKNTDAVFGIKEKDRRRHIWVVGKTGTGKSTMITNMVIDDFKKDRGVAVIDPHGDLCETALDYIPKHRINDTIYFNPADRDFPLALNPLEVTNKEEAELVVSGLMAVFTKIWANVWSARMEYILRNAFLTLAQIPNTTLGDVLALLTDPNYRNRIIQQTTDPVMKNYWINEFNKMPERQREEAISAVLNKVGQFVTSPLIRRIIGQPKSSVQLDSIMNDGKIFLANLSQGRLGEDNSALLGAMLITKFQLAAMRRVDIPEETRRDFYLYVDEFQNFATGSFIKILSEARKYRLCLMLANQYMAQIPEEVLKAILGNAGSLVSFAVGAEDAEIVYKEYAEVFTQSDLVNLSNFQIAIKLMIDGHSTRPFFAITLPLPASKNQNREKVIEVSRENWAYKPMPEPVADPTPQPPVHQPAPPVHQHTNPQPQQGGQQNYQPRQYNPHYNQGGRPPYRGPRKPYQGNKPHYQSKPQQGQNPPHTAPPASQSNQN